MRQRTPFSLKWFDVGLCLWTVIPFPVNFYSAISTIIQLIYTIQSEISASIIIGYMACVYLKINSVIEWFSLPSSRPVIFGILSFRHTHTICGISKIIFLGSTISVRKLRLIYVGIYSGPKMKQLNERHPSEQKMWNVDRTNRHQITA